MIEKIPFTLGITASRARSGGAKAHIIGILSGFNYLHLIKEIHIWSYPEILNLIPNYEWLTKHVAGCHSKTIIHQLYWEKINLSRELKINKCDILINVDAGSICRFHPNISMSRDMLSYEIGEMKRYGWTIERLRLILLKYVQNSTLRQADGVIFLTEYAAKSIQKSTGILNEYKIIPHGIGKYFHSIDNTHNTISNNFNCVYVSNYAPYKHQWNCIRAVANLRRLGFPIFLTLIGGGSGKSLQKVKQEIKSCDPGKNFVQEVDRIKNSELPSYLQNADIFIFASSCENMPNTLLEGMAAGLPIACSNRGPMPEVLKDGGVYFNPESIDEIEFALKKIIQDSDFRIEIGSKSKELSRKYSWDNTSRETFLYTSEVYQKFRSN